LTAGVLVTLNVPSWPSDASRARRLPVTPPLHQRTQGPLHQLGKDLPRQTRPPIRPRTVARGLIQLEQVFGQRACTAHEVKDQGGQQLCQGHAGFAPARTVSTARQRLERFREINSPSAARKPLASCSLWAAPEGSWRQAFF